MSLEDLLSHVPASVRQALEPFDWGIHGGAVRDTLMGLPVNDLDVFVVCSDAQLTEALSGLDGMKRTPHGHGFRGLGCDIWSSEVQAGVSSVPFTTRADMARYDFSINCVAVWWDGEFTEAPGASADIRSKILRVVVPSMVTRERFERFTRNGFTTQRRPGYEIQWLPEPPRPPVTDDPDPSNPWGWHGYNGGDYQWAVSSDGRVVGVMCRGQVSTTGGLAKDAPPEAEARFVELVNTIRGMYDRMKNPSDEQLSAFVAGTLPTDQVVDLRMVLILRPDIADKIRARGGEGRLW